MNLAQITLQDPLISPNSDEVLGRIAGVPSRVAGFAGSGNCPDPEN